MPTSMKKPELEDYGITRRQYKAYLNSKNSDSFCEVGKWFLGFVVLTPILVIAAIAREWGAVGFVGFVYLGLVWVSVETAIPTFKRSIFLRGDIVSHIRLYEDEVGHYRMIKEERERAWQEEERIQKEAERARQRADKVRRRKLHEYWTSLTGVAFERELATLFRLLGYQVKSTPTSGDQGVDLILAKDDRTTIVQCKGYKDPVGPATVRELYGSLIHFRADNAILACTGGFTSGVRDFVRGKPIELISAWELVTMASGMEHEAACEEHGNSYNNPICPDPTCGREMRIRSGRYSKFWGCTGYPSCRATRQA